MDGKLVLIIAFLCLSGLAVAQQTVRCTGPLSETQLIQLLEGSVPAPVIGQNVAKCGINFEPTEDAVVRLRSAGMPESVLVAVRNAIGPAQRERLADEAMWWSIKYSQSPAAFEDYLRRYPKGAFAASARQELGRLKVASMRGEMERALAAGQWDIAEVKIQDLLRIAPEEYEVKRWQQRIADGRAKRVNPTDGLRYVWIPPGTFMMGCSPEDADCFGDEKPAHPVTITKGLWMGQTPVTQDAYQRVRGPYPSALALDYLPSYGNFKGLSLPVVTVNWDAALAYCKAVGGRLPTEAEWEYAARAGSTSARYGNLDEIAWYEVNSGGRTHEVGQKQANLFRLYDTLGNVRQWTADWYGHYESDAQSDPSGPGSGQYKTLRGGSWDASPRSVRESFRLALGPSANSTACGFRCVWVPEPVQHDAPPTAAEIPTTVPRLSPQELNDVARRADAAFARQDYPAAATLDRQAADSGLTAAMNRLGYMYQNGQGVPRDDAQAVAWYRKAAESGFPQGMSNLGWMYQNGRGVAQDDAQAVAWYRKAAENGNAAGMTSLGVMYQNGRGVAQDDTQAFAWFHKAAENGFPHGMFNLGVMYQNGRGAAQDDAQAVAWYRKAAENGDASGMNGLGVMYEQGRGVAKDTAEALAWYRKAAALGLQDAKTNLKRLGQSTEIPTTVPKLSAQDLDEVAKRADAGYTRQDYAMAASLYQQLAGSGRTGAMHRLGYMYQNGQGVSRDDAQAVAWYRKAAESGFPAAMNNLGWMYSLGRGVAQDDAQAVAWYRKAAESGFPEAMTNLGLTYVNGQGVSRDDAQAVAWFRKAADNGDAGGMGNLGGMYATGRGVAQDDAQAVAWYRKAAENGFPHGMFNLGGMYATGRGVAQNDAQAVAWFRKAADNGDAGGMTYLGQMYLQGRGVSKDDAQAIVWFRKGAENGFPDGMSNLGWMYMQGRGVAQDDTEAVAWYRKAAEKGNPAGINWLGVMYEQGRGVVRDTAEALTWYRKAAALGSEEAKTNLKRLGQ